MPTAWLVIDFIFVFVAIAVLIVKAKLNPALALLLGTIWLGLTTGVPLADIATGLSTGFGSMMAEVGLLISLGVIMGFLMASYGAVQRIVNGILKVFGKKGSPFAFGLTLSTITPPIFFDVLVVLVAPIARRVAQLSNRPAASMIGPVSMGLAAGSSLVIPGPAMLAMLGALKVDVGQMLLPSWAITLPCMALSVFIWVSLVERFKWWDPEKDEEEGIDIGRFEAEVVGGTPIADGGAAAVGGQAEAETVVAVQPEAKDAKQLPMLLAVLPVITVLGLIVIRILVPVFSGIESVAEVPVVDFLGSAVIALFIGTLVALAIAIARTGLQGQADTFEKALETVGQILVVTACAGSLGTIITASGVVDLLKTAFEANPTIPLLIAWFIGAVFRTTVGGQMLGCLTAIGVVGPLIDPLGLSPILVILATGAGSLFGAQFTDNTFWMMKSMGGLSTRGTLKAFTIPQALMSVVTLIVVLIVDIFV
ncbi:MAG: GntP family permease [Propionibacteriaceae bacterium]|jgi:H+/gluconate symporter-like permease|nr:GntP family permease [Propionibacteriaceae bacterium]